MASIWGRSVDEYRKAAELLADAPPNVVAVEVNLSCPNLEGRRGIFAHDPELSAEVIDATAACGRPRWAKLSANTDRVVEVARRCKHAGAEAVTLINTLLGMVIDPHELGIRCSGQAEAATADTRSTRWPFGPCSTCTQHSLSCQSSASGAWQTAGTPSN